MLNSRQPFFDLRVYDINIALCPALVPDHLELIMQSTKNHSCLFYVQNAWCLFAFGGHGTCRDLTFMKYPSVSCFTGCLAGLCLFPSALLLDPADTTQTQDFPSLPSHYLSHPLPSPHFYLRGFGSRLKPKEKRGAKRTLLPVSLISFLRARERVM